MIRSAGDSFLSTNAVQAAILLGDWSGKRVLPVLPLINFDGVLGADLLRASNAYCTDRKVVTKAGDLCRILTSPKHMRRLLNLELQGVLARS